MLSDAPELDCPSNHTTLENNPLTLSCTVRGYPVPEVIWYKDGEEVDLKENLTRRDSGQYLITASNGVATVNVTVEIAVMCKSYSEMLKYLYKRIIHSPAFVVSLTYIV